MISARADRRRWRDCRLRAGVHSRGLRGDGSGHAVWSSGDGERLAHDVSATNGFLG